MPLKVGVTSGLYTIGRSPELTNIIKKLGYTITRGADCMELAADIGHEVTYTHGVEVRHIVKKQGVDVLFHGDLYSSFESPERVDWRDAQQRARHSLRSAVFIGAKYIDFHASVGIWLELVTFAGRKQYPTFVDHKGRFISEILKENKRFREWFVEKKTDYMRYVLTSEERHKAKVEAAESRQEAKEKEEQIKERVNRTAKQLKEKVDKGEMEQDNADSQIKAIASQAGSDIQKLNENIKTEDETHVETMIKKLEKGTRWDDEEFAGVGGSMDGYHIMFHYLFFSKDPMFVAMADQYKDTIYGKYKLDFSKNNWPDEAWIQAEHENDPEFKEFFYATVAAKFLEGHMESLFKWLNEEFIKKDIPKLTSDKKEQEELIKIANAIIIGIENPDARDAEHAGQSMLWRPKQLYATIKTMRKNLKTEKMMLIMDHEHLAMQGVDALIESRKDIKGVRDFGEYVISIHSNHPNPLHSHDPIEIGDIILYELIYNLRVTGFGKKQTGYLIFERGGGEDPFQRSVEALKLIAKFVEKEVKVDDLPPEFYGIEGDTSGNLERQVQIIMDHRMDPLKDLLEFSEEDWGLLSSEARKKGKGEVFKKGEFK